MKTLVIFTGKAGSGKSTAAETVREYKQDSNIPILKFAAPLYRVHNIFFKKKNRWFLQFLGKIVSIFKLRSIINAIWSKKAKELFKQHDLVICDDLRFPEEINPVLNLTDFHIDQLVIINVLASYSARKERTHNTDKQLHDKTERVINRTIMELKERASDTAYEEHLPVYILDLPNNDECSLFKRAIIAYLKEINL